MSDQAPDARTARDPDTGDDAAIEEVAAVSLRRRIVNVRTIGSLLFGALLLFLLFRLVSGDDFDWGLVAQLIGNANFGFLALAFVAYYATFPIRSLRWRFVLARTGVRVRWRDATEILFLSWFVNCLVPAKLGDLYRAYLLRANYGASLSRTVGTIFIERVADLIVIAGLALAAGFWSFRGRARPEIDALFIVGFAVAGALVVLVIVLRLAGAHLGRWLPGRIGVLWERFHHGSTGALNVRTIPVILLLTAAIWTLEGARLYFVIRALGLEEVNLGISASVFVALAASLLTAIPLTPAGFGFVEAGIVGALSLYGVTREPAFAVALTDRTLTVISVIILGGILYAFSRKIRRAHAIGTASGRSVPSSY